MSGRTVSRRANFGRVLPRLGPWRLCGGMILCALLAWCGGFVWFITFAGQATEPPAMADGIVALTGGAERVEAALRLLEANRGRRLLVSGIGGGTDLPTLARHAGLDPVPLADRVTLGRSATSTRGNAMETAAWVSSNNVRSLVVVTAYYHMPRALTELRRALPDIRLFPYPVLTPSQGNTAHPVATRLLLEEYNKYLLALTGVTVWLPEREAPRPGRTA
jgi:uncharacterized SAM-binding protein YcdF (DUF218 family)